MASKKVGPAKGTSLKIMTLKNYSELGEVMKDSGKLHEAEELYRTGLEGREKVLGKDHPETLNCMHNLALILEAKRKFNDAEMAFRATLIARERVLGAVHPDTCNTAFCLADLLRKVSRRAEAKEFFEFAQRGYLETLGESHKFTKLVTKRLITLEKEGKNVCVIL